MKRNSVGPSHEIGNNTRYVLTESPDCKRTDGSYTHPVDQVQTFRCPLRIEWHQQSSIIALSRSPSPPTYDMNEINRNDGSSSSV